jgi:rod shape-determining protein MreC
MKTVLQKYWRVGTTALIVAGLLLLAVSGYLAPVIRVVMNPVVAAQSWLATRYLAVYNLARSPGDVAALRQDNERLKTENALLRSQLIQLQEQQKDFSTLYALLNVARTRPDSDYLAAMVIGRDPSPFMRYVYINQGSDAGLRRGMPVVTDQGLAGRIVAVSADAAQVQLITDSNSAVNVRLPDTGADAMLVGSVTGDVTLEMVPQEIVVKSGELVLTSGLGGTYPSNLLVGQVVSVRKLETSLFQSAAVQPVVDFTDLRWLLVITDFKPVDLSPLQQGSQP